MSDFPACKYRLTEDGEIESRIFKHLRDVPKGWTGDRGKLKKEAAKIKAKAPKAPARMMRSTLSISSRSISRRMPA